MPKPKAEVNGSGMHIQFSLIKDGKNVFESSQNHGELSQEAYYFIGGLLAHSKETVSYTHLFEAIGVSQDVIDKYFTGTVSRVGGITLEDIEDNVEKLHSEAFDPLGLDTDLTLDSVGAHKMRCV